MKFVIVSPQQVCGGPIVLHALCKHLCDLGHDARILYSLGFGCGNKGLISRANYYRKWLQYVLKLKPLAYEPVKGCRATWFPFVGKDTIVVYPETMFGNPLGAKKIVRWLLYHYRFKQTPGAYHEKDLFVAYRDIFNDKELNPQGYLVKTPYFDLDTYKRYNFGERKGTCYIIRKGAKRPDLPQSFDGVIIDKMSEQEIVRIFNECKYCVSYDTQTAYSSIAALCGCISVVIPEEGKRKEDYLTNSEKKYGVAWGFSEAEIQYALETQHLVEKVYLDFNRSGKDSARNFVEICENYFQ